MRIGEIAALVGVSTRAVRHYHHLGLLPEPPRRANGYRDYTLRDAVLLARIRRLTELGLGLDEVRDVLADDAGRELVDVLEELDADLARQEADVRARRGRLGVLLEEARQGRLPAEGPVSPELAALFADLARAAEELPGPEPEMAVRDREVLALLDTVEPDGVGAGLVGALRGTLTAPGAVERAYDLYARLDALAGADAGDVRVDEAARLLAELLPDELAGHFGDVDPAVFGGGRPAGFQGAFWADFSPAQVEVIRRAMRLVVERAR
ncbi:MerR family transcriptional regulator [Streptomyces coeruleoprunus]|uniref:MerR family transcriptional regulator n=1 Tax=Streptomyces coeruleoprunus TaxID=285563 RepID=A0ABV9X846_9ACTN